MPPTPRTLLVIGSGPGIGVHVAAEFAKHGFTKIALVSRTAEQLSVDKMAVLQAAGSTGVLASVYTFQCDIGDSARLKQMLDEVKELGAIECVFFNAARVGPSRFFDFPVEAFEEDFNTTNLALYTTAAVLTPSLISRAASSPNSKPSFLVTNSMLYKTPMPSLFSLSVVKAAQRSLVRCLSQVYEKDGVHFGLVSVEGAVSESSPNCNPKNIADKTWNLYNQERGDWTLEVELPDKS
ncbi:hypothetical protein LTR50_002628 [Elasticomyces elasticus]|nr:hypothetical protein LTR50_002628 [Elasticomyces elasticus]